MGQKKILNPKWKEIFNKNRMQEQTLVLMYFSFKNTQIDKYLSGGPLQASPWVAGDTLPWAWSVTVYPSHAVMAAVLDVQFPALIICFL